MWCRSVALFIQHKLFPWDTIKETLNFPRYAVLIARKCIKSMQFKTQCRSAYLQESQMAEAIEQQRIPLYCDSQSVINTRLDNTA